MLNWHSMSKPAGLSVMAAVTAIALGLGASTLTAEPDDNELVIDNKKLVTKFIPPKGGPLDEVYSGWRFRTPETQSLQTDDFDNPGFVLVEDAEERWLKVEGAQNKSCASCHKDAATSMKGVRASMPKWHAKKGKPQALEHHINICREERMGAKAWKWESEAMLGMTAYVGLQSRGQPVKVQTDGPMKSWWERGKNLYYTRVGQLDMACAGCHEQHYGRMIRADHLSQGQINGFPVYRLKWQKLGSIHRRFKGCMDNIRAQPFKRGSDEFTALELYVASRGQGLSVESPAVRN